jgi:hypothetical protein
LAIKSDKNREIHSKTKIRKRLKRWDGAVFFAVYRMMYLSNHGEGEKGRRTFFVGNVNKLISSYNDQINVG